MPLQRGSDITGWGAVTKNLATNDEERAAWRFSTTSLLLALFVTGLVALLMAQVDFPVLAKALLVLVVFLFTTVLINGIYSTRIERAADEKLDSSSADASSSAARVGSKPASRSAAPATAKPKVAASAKAAPVKAAPKKPEPAPEPVASVPAAETVGDETAPGNRPAGLEAARDGVADDLTRIKGVGPKMAGLCNSLGFFHFDQIAAWTADEVAWVDDNLEGFKGRVSRDNWVSQAKVLAAGGETEFSSRQS